DYDGDEGPGHSAPLRRIGPIIIRSRTGAHAPAGSGRDVGYVPGYGVPLERGAAGVEDEARHAASACLAGRYERMKLTTFSAFLSERERRPSRSWNTRAGSPITSLPKREGAMSCFAMKASTFSSNCASEII